MDGIMPDVEHGQIRLPSKLDPAKVRSIENVSWRGSRKPEHLL
jgi:hypothetical protein